MADQIRLTGVRGFGRHGVLAHEQEFGQEFIADVTLDVVLDDAAASDDLADTIDYGQVAQLVHDRLVGEPHQLLEHLADAIAGELIARPRVRSATVTVHKPHAPLPVGFADVAVTRTRTAPARVVLALGSNLGDRAAELQTAVDTLGDAGVAIESCSPVVRSDPIGGPEGQGEFLNAVVIGRTDLDPFALLHAAQAIEDARGRRRDVRWGPRPIDIDLIDFDGRRLTSDELVLPHPRAARRGFVVRPWAAIAPGDRLGGTGPTVADLAASATDAVYPSTAELRDTAS